MICTVESLRNDTTGPAPAAELLSYLAVAPLLASLACVALLGDYTGRELAQRAAIAWGAVLLACTGAVHFGLALAGRLPATPVRTVASAAPAVVATLAVVAGGQRALALLVVGFGVFWLYEHRSLGALLPPAYLSLRRNLSVATCALLALTLIASDAVGLL
jgi:hypothetical protein